MPNGRNFPRCFFGMALERTTMAWPTELGHPVEDVTPDRGFSALRLAVPRLQVASEHGLVSEEAVLNARLLSVARLLLPLPSPDLANHPLKRRFTLRPGAVGGPRRQRRAMRGDHNHDVLCTGRTGPIVDRPVVVGPSAVKRRMGTSSGARRSGSVEASSRLLAVSSAATMNPLASTPMCSFRQSRRFCDALCLCAFHSPRPRILSPVESTIRSIGRSWARVRGGTTTIWFRRERVVWSGALRSRLYQAEQRVQKPLRLAKR